MGHGLDGWDGWERIGEWSESFPGEPFKVAGFDHSTFVKMVKAEFLQG
jgi:hypothetical protein